METVVSAVLTGVLYQSYSEVEARTSGWNRSPQQAESLAAAVRTSLTNLTVFNL